MFRQPMISFIGIWIVVTIGWFGFVTRGGECEFSPYTLEVRGSREYTLLGIIPLYRSRWQYGKLEFADFLIDEGYVSPVAPSEQRWIKVFHWNEAWSDGYGDLYRPLMRNRNSTMEWSLEDHERARHCWSRIFDLLRSDDERDVELGLVAISLIGRKVSDTAAEFEECLETDRAYIYGP